MRFLRHHLPLPALPFLGLLPVLVPTGLVMALAALAMGANANVWMIANLAVVAALFFPVSALHEGAHALVSRALGLRVFWVQFGTGPPIFDKQLGGTRLTFCRYMGRIETMVIVPPGTHGAKWKMAASLVAGPAVQAVLLAAAWIAFGGGVGNVVESFVTRFSPSAAFIGFNLVSVALNLLPWTVRSRTAVSTDGARVLRLLREPEKELAPHKFAFLTLEAWEAARRGDYDGFTQQINRGLDLYGGDFNILISTGAPVYNMPCDWYHCYRYSCHLMSRPEAQQAGYFVPLLNQVAYCAVMTRDASLLPSADQHSGLAFSLSPLVPELAGTRGVVLMHLGQWELGLKLLRYAYKNTPHKLSCATEAAWIAYGLVKLGKLGKAKRWLRRAHRLWPDAPELPIAAAEFVLAEARTKARGTARPGSAPLAEAPAVAQQAIPVVGTISATESDVVISNLLARRIYALQPTTERGEAWLIENRSLCPKLDFGKVFDGEVVVNATLQIHPGSSSPVSYRLRPWEVRLSMVGGGAEPSPKCWLVPGETLGALRERMTGDGIRVRVDDAATLRASVEPIVPPAKLRTLKDLPFTWAADTAGPMLRFVICAEE